MSSFNFECRGSWAACPRFPARKIEIFDCPNLLGARPLGGGRTGMGAGGSPCRSGRISGDSPPAQDCRGYRLRPRAGRRGDNAPKRHLCPRITGAKGVNREPAPWGEGARVWVRAAAPAGLGGLAAIRRPPRTAGATDCAQGRGGGGTMRQKGICAPELRGRRGLTCDMRDYRLR